MLDAYFRLLKAETRKAGQKKSLKKKTPAEKTT